MTKSESFPKEVSLLSGENVVMVLKRRYVSVITSFFVSLAALVIWSAGSITREISTMPTFWEFRTYYLYGVVFFIVLALTLVLFIGYFYVRGHLYILTNRRVILFRKFVTITIREVAYKEITDIMVNQGPIARILNYGSVSPLSPGVRITYALPYPYLRRPPIVRVSLRDVNQPYRVVSQLFQLIRAAK